jgi:CBS domain-containing protein
MSRRHMPADDFDADPLPRKPEPGPPAPARCRKVALRKTLSATRGVELERMVVSCPNRAAPELEECSTCAHFRGFSLDPSARDSFVSCAYVADADHKWPIPVGASERSRAMRTHLGEIMKDAVCVRPDVPANEVAALLTELGIGGVPLVSVDRKLVGIVSKTDLARARQEGTLAGEIASPNVVTLPGDATLAEAVALMSAKNLHRIPVVAEDGQVIGIVSSLDVMRWLAKPEGAHGAGPTPASL